MLYVFQLSLLSLLLVLVDHGSLWGQTVKSPFAERKGFPVINNYSPIEYQAHEQIWDIVQDEEGRMFFANGDGLLVYDHERWSLVTLINHSHARSLGLADNGKLYVGGDGDLGYVSVDEANQMKFVSLLSFLPAEHRFFGRVFSTLPFQHYVFFQTHEHLFIWDGKAFTIHSFEQQLGRLFQIRGEIYACLENKGIVRWANHQFQPIGQGDFFSQKHFLFLLPWKHNTILAGTNEDELFVIDRHTVKNFGEQTSLKGSHFNKALLLGRQFVGLATNSGFIILDQDGHQVQRFTVESGLPSMYILGCYVDQENNLWLGTQTGVAQIMTGYPLHLLNQQTGIQGVIEDIEIYEEKLFVATREGLFVADTSTTLTSFSGIPIFRDRVWSLFAHSRSLLVGYDQVLYEWRDNAYQIIGNYDTPASFYLSESYTDLLWVSLDKGFCALRLIDDKWIEVGKQESLAGSIRWIVEYSSDEVWLGSRAKGLFRLTFPVKRAGMPDFSHVEITPFGTKEGLPPGDIQPILISNQLYGFAVQTSSWYRFDAENEVFVEDEFGAQLNLTNMYLRPQLNINKGEDLWLSGRERSHGQHLILHAVQRGNGEYIIEKYPTPSNLSNFNESMYATENHLYMGGLEGILMRDRLSHSPDSNLSFPLITSVQFQQDILPFRTGKVINNELTKLDYSKNAVLRITFSAPFNAIPRRLRYQTQLVGFEETWSDWTNDPYKEYTNLWEGNYEFLLRSIDPFGNLSPPTRWSFTIAPPWYRQLWIYGAYLLCLISLVYGLVSWRSSQLKKDKGRLENMVQERTSQLAKQRNQLAMQSEKLQEMNKVKSRFFANISHEFRTPITLILGLLSKYQNEKSSADWQADFGIMKRNAKSLLQLINQLLELSRLEIGNTKLSVQKQDIVEFIRQKISGFQSLADQKKLQLTYNQRPLVVYKPMMPIPLYFDAEKLEQVINNLLANAIKYTPEGNDIDVSVSIDESYFMTFFKNTGVGISKDAQPHVFERFYQASDHSQYEGTGIGLAIVKELTALHHGDINLESIPGEYTTFILRLRLGHEHFKEEEISQSTSICEITESTPAQPTFSVLNKSESESENKQVVMIVEDNVDLRKFIKSQLSDQFCVYEAADGEAGWKAIEEELPDLVVSDIMMPKLNGMDLCQRIKTSEKTNHIPVVLLTAKATMEDKVQGLSLGADDYLVKPFDALELVTRIQNLIGLRQALRDKFATQNLLVPTQDATPSQQQLFLTKLRQLLDDYIDDEQFGVEKMSEQLSMSRTQTHRKIKAITGLAPSVLIRSYRLQAAKAFIRKDVGNFSDIAFRTGFSSLSYFSRCFQDEFGCSPSEFKHQEKGKTSDQTDWITNITDKWHNT